jgi:uncharacterized protein YjbJ (UPF0337 family)
MNDESTSDKAREGLLDSIKGKAKEVAGAVTGNDSLTAEGRFQQAEAQERRDAETAEALARAQTEEAAEELGAVHDAADHDRAAVRSKAEATKDAVRRQEEVQKRVAEQEEQQKLEAQRAAATREAQTEEARAEVRARATDAGVGASVTQAHEEHREAVGDAEEIRRRAEAERRKAENLGETLDETDR